MESIDCKQLKYKITMLKRLQQMAEWTNKPLKSDKSLNAYWIKKIRNEQLLIRSV